MTSEREKAELGAATLQTFLEQFGNDAHAQIVLEILFEELMNEKTVSILSQQEQEGDQADNDTPE